MMVHAAVAISLLSGAVTVQEASGDAAALLDMAANAMRAVMTVTYDAELDMRSATGRRVVSGTVTLAKFEDNTGMLMSGRVAVSGKVVRQDVQKIEHFKVAFDGAVVRRYLLGSGVVLQADAGYGGEGLLRGEFGSLILWHFLTVDPFQVSRQSPELSMMGTADVNGRGADIVNMKFTGRPAETNWYFDRETHYPVKRVRRFKSAQGKDVESVLTISNIVTGVEVKADTFQIDAPQGTKVELMGRRPPSPFGVGDIAPDWTLTDGDGVEHSMADYRGQLVVLDFWATWCPHCKNAMPAMQRLHDNYEDRGVAILGINCREGSNVDPVEFVRDMGFDYPILIDSGTVAPRYRVQGIPAFFVIGPDGRLLYRSSGFGAAQEQKLERYIREYQQ
jgi:thiol-disulfide isomerase/thioredoxin